jgi:hypothetical protein
MVQLVLMSRMAINRYTELVAGIVSFLEKHPASDATLEQGKRFGNHKQTVGNALREFFEWKPRGEHERYIKESLLETLSELGVTEHSIKRKTANRSRNLPPAKPKTRVAKVRPGGKGNPTHEERIGTSQKDTATKPKKRKTKTEKPANTPQPKAAPKRDELTLARRRSLYMDWASQVGIGGVRSMVSRVSHKPTKKHPLPKTVTVRNLTVDTERLIDVIKGLRQAHELNKNLMPAGMLLQQMQARDKFLTEVRR